MASTPDTGETEVRPLVARPERGWPGWLFAATALSGATLLFAVLEARRQGAREPAISVRPGDIAPTPAPAPLLYVPPQIVPVAPDPLPVPQATPAPPPPPPPPPPPAPVYIPQPVFQTPIPAPTRNTSTPILVVDGGRTSVTGGEGSAQVAVGTSGASGTVTNADRAGAGVLANRTTTVVQGTLIPAMLETALNSSRPGLARAIVSRDVRSFNGERVLIPRGSRLIGEYRSDAQPGQKRALVVWTRLIRPDGATIAVASPAADPLGGVGIHANVNNHFFQRFAGAILQSALDVGVNLASRGHNGAVVVALPGLQTQTQTIRPPDIPPTLTVRQGTSISVFVARDLDFSSVEKLP